MIEKALYAAKALVGALTAGIAGVTGAILSTSDGGSTITSNEWLVIGGAVLVGFTAVYNTKNRPKKPPQ